MKFVIIFVAIVASSQALPADFEFQSEKEIAHAENLKKLLNNAFSTAENHANSVAGEYKDTYGDLKESASGISADEFRSALRSASQKVQYYMQNLQTIMNEPYTSPEDKAHKAVSSLTPVLDGILSDFASSSNNIENLLETISSKAQNHAGVFEQSANNIVADSQDTLNEFQKNGQPELNNIYNAVQNDVQSQQAQFYNKVSPAIEDTEKELSNFLE